MKVRQRDSEQPVGGGEIEAWVSSHAENAVVSLEEWFAREGKSYPWRETHDPYAILVSEVMLQQTQITTVLERGFYARWMLRFPDISTLAAATEEEVLHAWQGLGYYRRARNLQKLAQAVVERHGGELPLTHAELLALPGIGPYTAGAIASFAYDLAEPLVDGNVARVLSRLADSRLPIDGKDGLRALWDAALVLVKKSRSPRLLNAALMELGQTHCRPGVPACLLCPVKTLCQAREPAELPVKEKKMTLSAITERVVFDHSDAGLLLVQETGSRRTGMWRLPELPEKADSGPVLHRMSYGITRYKVDLWVHLPTEGAEPMVGRRIALDQLHRVAIPAPYLKAIRSVALELGLSHTG
jgi:A/G-specific adenine glycosylase